jgi:tRNA(fMet)-specific endonuclease VapC
MGGTMKFLLDTNICSAHMRRPAQLSHRFIQYVNQIAIPTIVLAELYAGAYRHSNSPRLLGLIHDLLQEVEVLDFDVPCAEEFGRVRGQMLQQGFAGNTVDLMIASVALVHDLTLVTHNTADFQSIPQLRLQDWLKP